jgi:hypothetical protein
MMRGAGVFRGVAIGGRVAAQRHSARLTCTEMHPRRADLHALLTLSPSWPFDLVDCRDVCACIRHNERAYHGGMSTEPWPELPAAWANTYATLHMWTQIVGKIALAQAPPLNHSWAVALQLTSRGLITRPLPHGHRTFTIEFDFLDHQLHIVAADGARRSLPLAPRTVAAFYSEVMEALDALKLRVRIWPMPVEIPNPIRFIDDTAHNSYDREYVGTFWRILVNCERIFSRARCQFVGKASPVHFFWGSFDLAVTRFSGRPAPPREGPAFQREAYSHEVISHGFWPGSGPGTMFGPGPVDEPAFYAYAVPEPQGFKTSRVEPAGAFYHGELGEFILPYRVVQSAADPDVALLAFVDSTYSQAANLASWDRAALERPLVI